MAKALATTKPSSGEAMCGFCGRSHQSDDCPIAYPHDKPSSPQGAPHKSSAAETGFEQIMEGMGARFVDCTPAAHTKAEGAADEGLPHGLPDVNDGDAVKWAILNMRVLGGNDREVPPNRYIERLKDFYADEDIAKLFAAAQAEGAAYTPDEFERAMIWLEGEAKTPQHHAAVVLDHVQNLSAILNKHPAAAQAEGVPSEVAKYREALEWAKQRFEVLAKVSPHPYAQMGLDEVDAALAAQTSEPGQ